MDKDTFYNEVLKDAEAAYIVYTETLGDHSEFVQFKDLPLDNQLAWLAAVTHVKERKPLIIRFG